MSTVDPRELPQVRVSDADRERAHALVKEACLDGRLTLDELAQRVELVEQARTHDEIQAATRDLQAAPSRPALPSAASPRTVSSTTAIMSEVSRTGRWRVGEKARVTAVMGACKLDLRRATIASPVTTIQARIVMGALDIFVPEGVEVELETTTIMGSRTIKQARPEKGRGGVAAAAARALANALLPVEPGPAVGGPVVRVTGFAVMGAVNVHVIRE